MMKVNLQLPGTFRESKTRPSAQGKTDQYQNRPLQEYKFQYPAQASERSVKREQTAFRTIRTMCPRSPFKSRALSRVDLFPHGVVGVKSIRERHSPAQNQ
jgi:hypothetical protein